MNSKQSREYRGRLKAAFEEATGQTITKDNAYRAFRDMLRATFEFTAEVPENRYGKRTLNIRDVATFEVKKGMARGDRTGHDMYGHDIECDGEPWEWMPRLTMKPAKGIMRLLEEYYGFEDCKPIK